MMPVLVLADTSLELPDLLDDLAYERDDAWTLLRRLGFYLFQHSFEDVPLRFAEPGRHLTDESVDDVIVALGDLYAWKEKLNRCVLEEITLLPQSQVVPVRIDDQDRILGVEGTRREEFGFEQQMVTELFSDEESDDVLYAELPGQHFTSARCRQDDG